MTIHNYRRPGVTISRIQMTLTSPAIEMTASHTMNLLELVNLRPLMDLTRGEPDIVIGLVDGPVADVAQLAGGRTSRVSGATTMSCNDLSSASCIHGTFVASVLFAKRGSSAPAICPDCTLLLRPIFVESKDGSHRPTATTPVELANAIHDCVDAGARVINLSVGLSVPSSNGDRDLKQALDRAARRSTLVVAAAGNQGTIGSSVITRHPWTIPVAACDLHGRPVKESNIAQSVGCRGLLAPGERVLGIDSTGKPAVQSGTSVAAPFVTGAIGLLWSSFNRATATDIRFAITRSYAPRRRAIVPPLLDGWESWQFMAGQAGLGRQEGERSHERHQNKR